MIILPGKIKEMIDEIIRQRSKDNPAIKEMTIAKLILKGINPNKFHDVSPDDAIIMKKLINIAKELKIKSFENNGENIKAAFSIKEIEEDVVLDIKNQLNLDNVKLIILFAAPTFNQQKIISLMHENFSDCMIIGCSTAGEFTSGKILKNSVVAMAINSNIIQDVKVEVVENMKGNLSLETAFTSFEKYYNESLYFMDTAKYVGITLIDGLSMKEEKIMDLIGNRTDVFFVGGSAGDNGRFEKTYVYANGNVYTDAAILTMLKISDDAEFSVIKTQSFEVLDKVLVANKVNEEKRQVIEFNNRPATLEYMEAVNASSIEEISNYFMSNPLGLVAGEDNIFVRCPQQVNGTSMSFYCNILEGMEVKLLRATNMLEDTKDAIQNKIRKFGNIDGIISFHCIHRITELERQNFIQDYAEIFTNIPTIGFSAYGEQFIGHINQTAAMLVFRQKQIHRSR
ncbi:FIST N-terminal domain-containing protein [Clostridium sp.]|uniref:FIST signal transduction protein n=1 Tax=Clostridium sp. TaxID=1506 RepID=UPI002852C7AE|nr:FIST N-terminal domain-containing protein [Clostridium sp.]